MHCQLYKKQTEQEEKRRLKKQSKEVAERSMIMRNKLSWEKEEEKKNIKKVDDIIKGTKFVRILNITMSIGLLLTGIYIISLLYEQMGMKVIPVVFIGCTIFYGFIFVVLKLQLKLYKRTMDKIAVKIKN